MPTEGLSQPRLARHGRTAECPFCGAAYACRSLRDVPTYFTPRWAHQWDGDPKRVLDATEAAERIFRREGLEFSTRVDIKWGDGAAVEQSVADAKERLHFAQRPEV